MTPALRRAAAKPAAGVRESRVAGLSNREFLEKYAAPGRVALAGGSHWIDRAIRRSERRLRPDASHSPWSHAMIFEGRRIDGRHWLIEADVDWAKAQFRNGVQENPADKYFDEKQYPFLAVLDFGLDKAAISRLLAAALSLVAERTRYSYGGILSTWLALQSKTLDRRSPLHGDRRAFCSSLVQFLYLDAGIRFAPDVDPAHVTPEHISQCRAPHSRWVLTRQKLD